MSRLVRLLIAGLLLGSTLATTLPAQGATPLSVSLNPTTGLPGSATTVTGTGFMSGEPLQVAWYDSTVLANTNADNSGNLTASITIPSNASAGQHPIAVWDQALNLPNPLAVVWFTVGPPPTPTPSCPSPGPAVSISPLSGPPGTQVTATGTGWPTGQQVQYGGIGFGGASAIDANGNFSLTFTIPADVTPGNLDVSFQHAAQPCLITYLKTFTVTAPPPPPVNNPPPSNRTAATEPAAGKLRR